jgi:hypothetical protein
MRFNPHGCLWGPPGPPHRLPTPTRPLPGPHSHPSSRTDFRPNPLTRRPVVPVSASMAKALGGSRLNLVVMGLRPTPPLGFPPARPPQQTLSLVAPEERP